MPNIRIIINEDVGVGGDGSLQNVDNDNHTMTWADFWLSGKALYW